MVVDFGISSLDPMSFQGSHGLAIWIKLPIMI